MKQKTPLLALGLLILVVIGGLRLRDRNLLQGNLGDERSQPRESNDPPYLTTTAARQAPGGPYAPADPRWPERTRKLQEDPQYEWKTPIEFYGKVVDQDGMPVEGVKIHIEWTDMSPKGTSEADRTTDGSGFFFISGIQGKNLGIRSIGKDGYEPCRQTNRYSFEYAGFWEPSYHIPDKRNPVVFRLRKKGAPAALMHHGPTLFRVKPDGTPAIFDLASGQKNIGSGDFSIRVTKGGEVREQAI